MLDTVNPDAVRAAFADRRARCSSSPASRATTIEPVSLAAEARRVASAGAGWGAHAVAITDPDTALHREAVQDGFRDVFVNPPDIGGRYSALSLFGMVPAALMGADLDGLVASGAAMERDCRRAARRGNPGLALGALMAAAAANGRDKLTLLLPPRLRRLRPVGRATGRRKHRQARHGRRADHGRAADSPSTAPTGASWWSRSPATPPDAGAVARARASGAPWISIDVPRATDLAAEFLRWEVATAIAGLLLGVNPFDEPNVKQAKDATTALLDAYPGTAGCRSPSRTRWPAMRG